MEGGAGMRIQRDEMYFEARVVDEVGRFHWYGKVYQSEDTELYSMRTVYIRDSGKQLWSYDLTEDHNPLVRGTLEGSQPVKAELTLICSIPKQSET